MSNNERLDNVGIAKGIVYKIDDESANQYPKKFFTIHIPNERDSKYDQYIKIECYGDNMNYTNKVNIGDYVEFEYYVQGKKYNKKDGSGEGFFTSISYKYTNAHTPAMVPVDQNQQQSAQASYQPPPMPDFNDDIEDDIPF